MDIPLTKEKYFQQENVKISIVLDNYCIKPEGYIEGSIMLIPIIKGQIKLKDTKIILTLTQYEFFDYFKSEKESSNIQKHHNQQHKEIIFNKEAKFEIENNTILCTVQIPIKVSMPKNDKLFPSFNLKNKDLICGVRHIFTVKIPEINAINSCGILISELQKNKENKTDNLNIVFKDEQIYKMGLINKGKISYCIRTSKIEYKYDDNIDMKITVDSSGLQELNIQQLKVKLQRKIIIFGYTVNSDFRYTLNEKLFEKKELSENSNKYELEYTIPKIDDNVFSEKDIEQYVHFNDIIIDGNWKNKSLVPSMKGYLFGCEYKIKIRTILDSSLITTKKIDLPIQLYFPDDYFNKFKLSFKQEEEVKFGSFIIVSPGKYNNEIKEDDNKEEKDKENKNKDEKEKENDKKDGENENKYNLW